MDGTYAPQSPDLSGFQSSPSKQQQLYQPIPSQQPHSHPQQQIPSYAPRSPIIPSFAPQYTTNAYQDQSLNLSPHQPRPHQETQYNFPPSEFSEYGTTTQYMPAIPALPASHSFNAPTSTPSYYNPPIPTQEQQYNPFDGPSEYIQSHNNPPKMSSRGRPRVKAEESLDFSSAPQHQHQPPQQQQQIYKNPNPLNIEIRTKFPVARIKRIMQADEEVGKVAQVTPVAVNKALELFMIALVTGAADKAREKGGKRVTAQHLKSVVEGDETFDFLKDIVERVADVQENAGGEGRKRKTKVEGSDSEVEEKPKKGKGRRKKSEE